LSQDTVESVIIPIIVHMAADSVPNVRLNVARTIQDIVATSANKYRGNFLEKCVAPTLAVLCEDTDRDVRFYASQVSQN
jgi:serine/threonine-protein phosphatase 2A regulatory subunit A